MAISGTYVVVKQSPKFHQMSLEEFLTCVEAKPYVISNDDTSTRTYRVSNVSEKFSKYVDVNGLIMKLYDFNNKYQQYFDAPRNSLYHKFFIPKSSGGLREINAPNPGFKEALSELARLFKSITIGTPIRLYHTSAFAYIDGRSTVRCVERHQKNESWWFAKFDLHGFFPSTTLDFIMQQFSMVYPFSAICARNDGRYALRKALSLGMLDGGLPQGSPLSPMVTNIMMIPIDFELTRALRNNNHFNFVNTRYADDFLVSCRYKFDYLKTERLLVNILREFQAPFYLNSEKTRFGSRSGSNWNLGIMLNAQNEMTIGYKKRRQFMKNLHAYGMDAKNGNDWDLHDVQVLHGYTKYYTEIMGEDKIIEILDKESQEVGIDIWKTLQADLKLKSRVA